jgi:predicted metal-dependent peptidase
MTPKDIIAAARIRCCNRHPYLASVLMALRPVESDRVKTPSGMPTLGVDAGWRLFYHPDAVRAWGVGTEGKGHDGISVVLAHECWHCLFDSHGRMKGRDAQRWNESEDYSINDDLVKTGWKFPTKALVPGMIPAPEGETGETYYELLQKQQQAKQASGESPPGCGGKCGGCAGNPNEWEDNSDAQSVASGDAHNSEIPDPISEAEKTILRRKTAQDIQAHGKQAGNLPAHLKAWAELELSPPRVDWRKQLAALVRTAIADKAGAADYSYKRPSRRQWGLRAVFGRAPILPCLRSPVPVVKGVLDVSGSMAGSPAELARAEIVGVCRAVGSPVEWVSCDTQIAARAMVSGKRDIAKLGDTGGGTDLRTGIAELDKAKCDVICVLTDGFSPFPKRGETRAKLIAAITPDGERPPEYIPCVMIEGDAK